MYLKSLEACGFKSFADRTKLEFEKGITAIVGPNGCGKSNVADAIRWCLGEQSAKSLRSRQMMDVIFNGSQSRATTGMCEVSLTFDNSQNMLPVNYSEVTVTRRLFRSGESEYFINKIQCRLKDVRDLFLDTGVGAEGYSIIEQGKVEFILSARPEEKRELFEEAAGVSKYKARREESLRKLERVEIDMNRVNDMLAMLKEQISALDAAARKARLYKKHQEDLIRLEIASSVQQILGAKAQIERLEQEYAPRKQEFEITASAYDTLDAEISQLRLTQIEKDELYMKMQDELSKVKSGIDLSDERIHQAATREAELSERLGLLASEIEKSSLVINQQEEELKRIQNLRQEISGRVKELEQEYNDKEALAAGIRESISSKLKEENEFKARLFELQSQKTALHNEINRLSSYQVRCQTQILAIQKESARLKEQFSPLDEVVKTHEKELEDFHIKETQILSRQDTLKYEIDSIQAECSRVLDLSTKYKERIVSIEAKMQTLNEWEHSDPQRSAIHAVLDMGLSGIRGPVSNLLRIVPGAEEIVAASMGDKLNCLVSDSAETAHRAIKFLEENNLGRASFVIEENIPDTASTDIAGVSGAQKLLTFIKYDSGVEKIIRYLCGETMVHGRTIHSNAIIQGGGQITFDKPVLIEEQLRKLAEELSGLKNELLKMSEEEKNLNLRLQNLTSENKELDIEHQKIRVRSDWFSNQASSRKEELHFLIKEMELNLSDMAGRQAEETQATEQIKTLNESLKTIEEEEKEITSLTGILNSEIINLRQEDTRMTPLLTEAKVAWATQENELSSRQREEEKVMETISVLKHRMDQYRSEQNDAGQKIAEQQLIQQNETLKLKNLYIQHEENDKKVQIVLKERQNITAELEDKTRTIHQLKQKHEQLEQELHHCQMEQKGYEIEAQNHERRLSEEYGRSFAEVQAEYSVIAVNSEEILRLRRKIESMGPVNLAAPEEYAQLEERYNFLLTQQQDLLKAKEDLHHVINKINQSTRENFKKTFEQVRENFRTLYGQLFEGGEADLALTNEQDLLECGVDIFAQPPGKKLQNIALLSGGEKALTAIALLFAFFMVRPSPFCILDEVDAPLDDANVGRFINIVKSFAANSQFLIITHSKRTMETADILYGVTMEQLGVSKIISVKLQKREELAVTA